MDPSAKFPRVLTIMGSGETAPTMTSVHAGLLQRVGDHPAVMLDTPFGFQMNAAELVAKAKEYFAGHVGHPIEIASFRRAATASPLEYETMLSRVRTAGYVFAGPGSPSYAVRQWRDTAVPSLLGDKLATGGMVTFASAAACGLGRQALPVYEIYKVGAEPHWVDGLDLMRTIGVDAVVIPHYDNAEGGGHDTRFCYMGEERLRLLEEMLDPDTFILGVDEHTALLLDLDAGTATVRGRAGVTLRRRGGEQRLETGTTVALEVIRTGGSLPVGASTPMAVTPSPSVAAASASDPLETGIDAQRRRFHAALATGDVDDALAAVLDLEELLHAWTSDSLQSDLASRGRQALREMVVRLGELARIGTRDPRDDLAPVVEAVLARRQQARAERRFAEADGLRESLLAAGLEVSDGREGATTWSLPVDWPPT